MAYITESEANTQYATVLPTSVWGFDNEGLNILIDVWEDATPQVREKALEEATRIIDSFTYDGHKTDEGQEYEFPRMGQASTPKKVKDATLALAVHLLKRHVVKENMNPWLSLSIDSGVKQAQVGVADTREFYIMKEEKTYYQVVHPYLKLWLKGRYNTSEWRG